MNGMQTYLLSVLAAAVICAIVKQFFQGKSGVSAVVHLLTGIFLAVTMIRPILSVSFSTVTKDIEYYTADASEAVQNGESQAGETLEKIIKEQTQAYIQNEADRLHADISVDVRLSSDELPIPVEITVCGAVSPYVKACLMQMIEQDIGVSGECQVWIS